MTKLALFLLKIKPPQRKTLLLQRKMKRCKGVTQLRRRERLNRRKKPKKLRKKKISRKRRIWM